MGEITGDAETGKQLYYDHACYGCHGYTGETGHQMKLIGSGFLLNEQTFIIYLRLRAEQNPILPSETMPNYPGKRPQRQRGEGSVRLYPDVRGQCTAVGRDSHSERHHRVRGGALFALIAAESRIFALSNKAEIHVGGHEQQRDQHAEVSVKRPDLQAEK